MSQSTRPVSDVVCPRCGNTEHYRIPRNFLLRLLPTSRRYRCRGCDRQFVTLWKQPERPLKAVHTQ